MRASVVTTGVGLAALGAFLVACELVYPDVIRGGPTDGASEARPEDAETGGSWCAAQGAHTLCEDFDEADAGLPGPWDTTHLSGNGMLSIRTDENVSAPNALRAEMAPGPSSATAAALFKTFKTAVNGFSFAFDFRPEEPDMAAGTVLAQVLFPLASGSYYAINLRLLNARAQVYEQQGTAFSNYYSVTPDAGIGAWQRINIEVTLQPPALTVFYGGVDAGTLPMMLSTSISGIVGTSATTGTQVSLGFAYINQPTTVTVDCYFDNVTFDAK